MHKFNVSHFNILMAILETEEILRLLIGIFKYFFE